METIAWYKNKEGLFYITKSEKTMLFLYILFLIFLLSLLWIPFPNYQHYLGVKEKNTITFSLSKKNFSHIQKSELYIGEDKYNFKIIKKEENELEILFVTIEVKERIKEKHHILEIILKEKKKSRVEKLIETIRKEWSLSPN